MAPARAIGGPSCARTWVVRQNGKADFRTIQEAAEAAQPGDTVLIYSGTYRETVTIPAKDTTAATPITFKAGPGQKPVITGAVVAVDWEYVGDDVWRLIRPNSLFGTFNPFATRWAVGTLPNSNVPRTTGGVYLASTVLAQQATLDAVKSTPYSWTATVDATTTTIHANFKKEDPNRGTAEINRRKQNFSADWNQAYINVDGLTITRGAGPKDVNYWRSEAIGVQGALSVNGGYKWTIRNNTFVQNSGVALDFGMGSQGVVDQQGGLPAEYGGHRIEGNLFEDNATNGALAWKGPDATVTDNRFINNNQFNTELVSEAYFKIVDEGTGVQVLRNYFYSDQDWPTLAVWMDSEIQGSRVSQNVFVNTGGVEYEANFANNLFDNNIMLNRPVPGRCRFTIREASGTYVVHNLFVNTANVEITTSHLRNGEGYDSVARRMYVYDPQTWERLSRHRVRIHENLIANNLFYARGIGQARFQQPATPDRQALETGGRTEYLANRFWDNRVDYNVYYDGAQPMSNFNLYSEVPDEKSTVVPGNHSVSFDCTPESCTIYLDVDDMNTPMTLGTPQMTAEYMGESEMLPGDYADDVTTDFFGKPRGNSVTVGPFAATSPGVVELKVWPPLGSH